MSLRIIIADDNKNIRKILRILLEAQTGMEVVAEADDGIMAVQLSSEFACIHCYFLYIDRKSVV